MKPSPSRTISRRRSASRLTSRQRPPNSSARMQSGDSDGHDNCGCQVAGGGATANHEGSVPPRRHTRRGRRRTPEKTTSGVRPSRSKREVSGHHDHLGNDYASPHTVPESTIATWSPAQATSVTRAGHQRFGDSQVTSDEVEDGTETAIQQTTWVIP